MISDQVVTNTVCKQILLPSKGFLNCSKEGFYTFFTRKGRKRFTNSIGTTCKLICPTGFRMVGEYEVICGSDGEWNGIKEAKCLRRCIIENYFVTIIPRIDSYFTCFSL